MTMQVIEHIEVGSGGAASITFSAISADYTDLVVVVSARTNRANLNDYLRIRLNGSTTNYSMRYLYGDGSSAASSSDTQIYTPANGGNTTANAFSSQVFYIPNYTSSSNKSVSAEGLYENNGTQAIAYLTAGLWSDTSAITSIELTSIYGATIVEYSSATLYGITAGSDGTTTVS